MPEYTVTELSGDGIATELAAAVRTVVAHLPIALHFESSDLSLPNRASCGPAIYEEAAASLRRNRFGLKYPTITEKESPNAILRQLCDFSVIHRPVSSIPGVP